MTKQTNTVAIFRLKIYTACVVILFSILFGRLWYLQVVQGRKFLIQSEENRIRLLRVKAPRGIISDADGFALVRNRPSFNVFVIREDIQDMDDTAARLERFLPLSQEEIINKVKRSRRPKFEPTLVYPDVDLKTVAYLEEHKIEFPGVIVEVDPLRYSIYEEAACHLVGYLGEITERELSDKERYPDARQGDLIGKSGVEQMFNLFLSGKAGGKQIEVNAHGRELGTISQKNPIPGDNVTLTINLHLQLLAEEALGDNPGTVIAINPQNGHVLAMVSHPTFNPNLFAGGISSENWSKLIHNPNKPLRNKVIQNHYAPGSTFKPMVGSAVLQNKVISSGSVLHCAGYWRAAGTVKHCWKAGGHGYVDIRQAIEQSCNVFFYQAGVELGIDELARYATSYGFGAKTGIELPNEDPGLIPTREWKRERFNNAPWYPAETMDAAIGQGFVSVTPLQIASMTATIANGGEVYKPMLIKKITKANGEVVQEYQPTVVRRVPVEEKYLQIIREGMWMVVNGKKGTARGSKIKEFEFAGKTGTAQVVRLQDWDSEEEIPVHLRDHGWFISFAPVEKPEIAMAILVEHGMGGSRSAAPIAKYIYERLYKPQDFLVKNE